jgi:hypothetical protein
MDSKSAWGFFGLGSVIRPLSCSEFLLSECTALKG